MKWIIFSLYMAGAIAFYWNSAHELKTWRDRVLGFCLCLFWPLLVLAACWIALKTKKTD